MLKIIDFKRKHGRFFKELLISYLTAQVSVAVCFILGWFEKSNYYVLALFIFIVVLLVNIIINQMKERNLIKSEVENERLRGELLRSISHDIRTPLTTIMGACSALIDNYGQMEAETKVNLLKDISSETQWLLRIVENALSITKINGKTSSRINRRQELLEEIIAEAIGNVKKRFPDSVILTRIPDEPLLISVDAILIEQVLINLVENALIHANNATKVELNVRLEREKVVFEIIDDGDGIDIGVWELESEINRRAMVQEDSMRKNMGIGLSVCKAIIKAHNGIWGAYNSENGGAVFWFSLRFEKNVV